MVTAGQYQDGETRLDGGGVRVRASGLVSDPLDRSGFEKKFPEPGEIGLPGYVRWHLAGPNATGTEKGSFGSSFSANFSFKSGVTNSSMNLS
jgi:hypothetical protein